MSGAFLQSFYLAHRYTTGTLAPVYRWADSVHHARIGASGPFLIYPLYGNDLTNAVAYVGDRTSHDYYSTPPNCVAWREADQCRTLPIRRGHGPRESRQRRRADSAVGWTRTDRSAHLIATAGSLSSSSVSCEPTCSPSEGNCTQDNAAGRDVMPRAFFRSPAAMVMLAVQGRIEGG